MDASAWIPQPGQVTVFAASWCAYCRRLRAGLDAAGQRYELIDVDADAPASRFVESVNGGNRVVPTVLFPDGSTLTNPPAEQVVARL